jgi:hypothetical protein
MTFVTHHPHISANSANPAILPDHPVILLKFSKVSKFTGSSGNIAEFAEV